MNSLSITSQRKCNSPLHTNKCILNWLKTEISTEDIEIYVHLINKSRPMTDKKLNTYCEKTTDELLLTKYAFNE